MKIIDDDDPEFYYYGRVSVGDLEKDKNIATISVDCDCEPYKYRLNKTANTVVVTGSKTVELENLRQHVVPVFNSTAQISIDFDGNRYSVSSTGEYTIPEIVLKEGINEYLTRKLALKYNFKTNGCAYYKEVFIVYKLEKILGEDIINRIAFISDENKTFEFLSSFVNKDISNLYKEISSTMEKESYYKYKIYFNNFDGISGVNEKIKRYDDIDYSKVLNIFSKYDKSLQK